MQRVLVATDSDAVFDHVDAALGADGVQIDRVRTGREVRAAVAAQRTSLVVLDLQIGSMGGIAACLDLRLEASGGRLDDQNILLLLDRDADVFVARRSGADGWVIKPLDAASLQRAAATVSQGGSFTQEPQLA